MVNPLLYIHPSVLLEIKKFENDVGITLSEDEKKQIATCVLTQKKTSLPARILNSTTKLFGQSNWQKTCKALADRIKKVSSSSKKAKQLTELLLRNAIHLQQESSQILTAEQHLMICTPDYSNLINNINNCQSTVPVQITLDLLKEISNKNTNAALEILNNFNQLPLYLSSTQERFKLLASIGACNEATLTLLCKNFNDYKYSKIQQASNFNERLLLCRELIALDVDSRLVFKLLGLHNLKAKDHLNLCTSDFSNLISNVNTCQYNASLEEILKLYDEIAYENADAALYLLNNFNQLPLDAMTRDDRLKFLASLGAYDNESLNLFFEKYKNGEFGSSENFDDRLYLCQILAELSIDIKVIFQSLDLVTTTVDERLELWKKIAQSDKYNQEVMGWGMQSYLFEDLQVLSTGLSSNERIKFLSEIISVSLTIPSIKEQNIAKYILNNPHLFKLNESTHEQRFILYKEIASAGELELLLKKINSNYYLLGSIPPDVRLNFYKTLIRENKDNAKEFARILVKSSSSSNEIKVRNFISYNDDGTQKLEDNTLDICRELLNQGEEVADVLAEKIYNLYLSEKDMNILLSYATLKGVQAYFINTIFDRREYLRVRNRQLLIDLLTPPANLRDQITLSTIHDVIPFFDIKHPIFQILSSSPAEITQEKINEFKKYATTNPKLKDILTPLLTSIDKVNPKSQASLINWIAYTAAVLEDLKPEQLQAFTDSNVLQKILSYQNTTHRYNFVRAFRQLAQTPTMFEKLASSTKHDAPFLLSSLTNFGISETKHQELIHAMNSSRDIQRDRFAGDRLAQLLSTINANLPYTTIEADLIANQIIRAIKQEGVLNKNKSTKMKKDFADLTNILQIFYKDGFLAFVSQENADPAELFKQNLTKFFMFTYENLENLDERFARTFGELRDPSVLFSYARYVDRLPLEYRGRIKDMLSLFVNTVLEGTYLDARYDPTHSPHLEKITENHSHVLELWKTSLTTNQNKGDQKENRLLA